MWDRDYMIIEDFPNVARASFFQKNWRAPLKVNIQFKVNKVNIQFLDVSQCYSAGLGSLVPIDRATVIYPPLFTLSGARQEPSNPFEK